MSRLGVNKIAAACIGFAVLWCLAVLGLGFYIVHRHMQTRQITYNNNVVSVYYDHDCGCYKRKDGTRDVARHAASVVINGHDYGSDRFGDPAQKPNEPTPENSSVVRVNSPVINNSSDKTTDSWPEWPSAFGAIPGPNTHETPLSCGSDRNPDADGQEDLGHSQNYGDNAHDVPEPSGAGLGLLGLAVIGGFVVTRRKRSK